MEKKVFDLAPAPLAHFSRRGFQYDLDRTGLTRMVNALVDNYDVLDLGNLSWAYWHACAATVHIAPAHLGAAIEALERAYVRIHPDVISTRIMARAQWKEFKKAIDRVVADAGIPEDSKSALMGNLGDINRVPQRTILRSVAQAIGIELGADENAAWQRRNDAAHGEPIPEGDELAAIRDMKLLRGLFHRMLLRISNAADAYVDYVTPGHPHRPLHESVPPIAG